MKLIKFLSVAALSLMLVGCGQSAGELVGVGGGSFTEANPYGMVFIRRGAFMMGANAQSAIFNQPDNPTMVTVDAFWMDETEITNTEYKQFVYWVRDSIAYTLLVNAGMTDYAVQPKDGDFDEENFAINWKKKIPWNAADEEIADALSPMYYSDGSMNTTRFHYHYNYINYDQAVLPENKFDVAKGCYPESALARVDTTWVDENGAIHDSTIVRRLKEPKDLLTEKIINVYPDTMVWVRDFQFAFNDPLLQKYFEHEGFAEYPVVGITWEQAHAFCKWRTKFLIDNTGQDIQEYRLPTEAEWEYAARGGHKLAAYPWGGNYARDGKGCFLANFKPYHGSYTDDMGSATMRVAQYRPNDFGLFDMAGNVSEWTSSAYSSSANTQIHDLNPSYQYMARKDDPDVLKRKVIKGGSWKDVSYFLRCGSRAYEYQYESRPYIGFRCVRSYIGE